MFSFCGIPINTYVGTYEITEKFNFPNFITHKLQFRKFVCQRTSQIQN